VQRTHTLAPRRYVARFFFSMAEVEALKQARREANAAKRAAGETVATDGDGTSTTETALPPPPDAPKGPVEQISAAEAKLEGLLTEITTVTDLVAAAKDNDSLDAAAKRQAAVSAGVGQLTAMMDEIDIGEIEDEDARTAARVRRKAINKRCALASSGDVEVDGDLAAANATLKKSVVAARNALK
jgi:hypothetical protein